MSVDLGCDLAGLQLSSCILNASGPRTQTPQQLLDIAKSSAGAVCSKSATLLERSGNEQPRYTEIQLGDRSSSLNSEGLPNLGLAAYIEISMLRRVKECSKPYILSISGLSLQENMEMLDQLASSADVMELLSAVEVNVACPNVPNKPLVGYDFPQLALVLKQISVHRIFEHVVLGVKLPPYLDAPLFDTVADMLNACSKKQGGPLGYVVCCNTLGSALAVDVETESTILHPKGGFGGLGGPLVRYVALGNVKHFRERLDASVHVVGCGGVATGEDAFMHILCGATAVQVATQHRVEGPGCFERISEELRDVMRRKGYTCLEDFRGKLRLRGRL